MFGAAQQPQSHIASLAGAYHYRLRASAPVAVVRILDRSQRLQRVLFYTPIALATIYYFLPKVIGRPVQSYSLSLPRAPPALRLFFFGMTAWIWGSIWHVSTRYADPGLPGVVERFAAACGAGPDCGGGYRETA
jgi:hypothetical protein